MIRIANGSQSLAAAPEAQPKGLYEVLMNQEEQLALWPADLEIPYSPNGWLALGMLGTEQECLNFIEEHGRPAPQPGG